MIRSMVQVNYSPGVGLCVIIHTASGWLCKSCRDLYTPQRITYNMALLLLGRFISCFNYYLEMCCLIGCGHGLCRVQTTEADAT